MYHEGFYIRLLDCIEGWAVQSGVDQLEVLQGLCAGDASPVIFNKYALKSRSSNTYLSVESLKFIAAILQSGDASRKKDAATALADVLVSADAIRDYCKAILCRPPDRVVRSGDIWECMRSENLSPQVRESTEEEIFAAKMLVDKKSNAIKTLWGRRQAARSKLSAVSGVATEAQLVKPLTSSARELQPNSGGEPLHQQGPSKRSAVAPRQLPVVPKFGGYEVQDSEIILRASAIVVGEGVSAWAALKRIPDSEIAGHGTMDSRRKRIHRQMKKS